jgi:hypothetical protein
MSKGRLASFVLFELPKVLEVEAHMEADRPVVIFFLDGILQGLALGMALDTNIVGLERS